MPQVKGGVPTWKSEYIEGRQRSHKGTAGGLAVQIAAAGDRETAADTSALSGVVLSIGLFFFFAPF